MKRQQPKKRFVAKATDANGKNYHWLKRIYKLLASRRVKIIFKRFRKIRGLCSYKLSVFFLDPAEKILPTLIHECLHFIYRDWSEARVVKMENKIFNSLSPAQIKHLLNHLTAAVNATKRSSLKTKKKG